ncbi:MAG: sulfatase-like hydrolase/transferase [Polyangiales bacterium]
MDLTERFQHGLIDTAGPVLDLGEPQAMPWLRGSGPLSAEVVNGSSWARVGARLRMRVVIDPTRAPEEPPANPPQFVRLRLRHVTARQLSVIVDGLLVRAALIPAGGESSVLSLAVPPDRFRRSVADVELRFSASRAVLQAGAPVASVDWVQLSREEILPERCVELVSDVTAGGTPRRALTLYAPTELSTLQVLPERAVWRMSLASEAPRGAARASRPVMATIRAEADGVAVIERRVEVAPNVAWRDLALDLSTLGGRPARLSVRADRPENLPPDEPFDVRLAVAAPRLERAAVTAPARSTRARHVVMVVLRGARLDRFVPQLSTRFTGGFATMVREGLTAQVTTGSVRAWAALQTAATGIAADQHGLQEVTDLLSDEAPTPGTVLAEHAIQTAVYTDEAAWIGSGADRGYGRREGCPEAQPLCRVGPMFQTIADNIRASRGSSFTLLVTRGGTLPLDPPNDLVLALDSVPFEGTLTPAQTGVLATRARTTEIRLEPRDRARLDLLYDASLLTVDRGLALLIERLQAHRLDDATLLLVVGDRGVALADGRYFGDAPIWRPEMLSTVLLARGPGIPRGGVLRGVAGTLDGVATALDALGVPLPEEFGGVSLFEPERLQERALPMVATPRGDVGLRFGDWLALPRPAPQAGVSLFDLTSSARDADLGDANPIARLFAEARITSLRGDGARRTFARSTRALVAPTR